jgi:chemotaxis protein histidine kinase CheA
MNIDPALLELFRAEMDAHIPVLSQGLLALEKEQNGDTDIASMMRAAHSIKGAARIVGIDAAVRVAHVMEDCFTAARENRSILTSEAVDILLEGVDSLQQICALDPDAECADASVENLVARLNLVKEGRLSAAPATPVVATPLKAGAEPPSLAPARPAETLVFPEIVDHSSIEELRAALSELLEAQPETIRLDLAAVRQISALGLSLLASLSREAGRLNPPPTLEVGGVSGPFSALLRVTSLDRSLVAHSK